MRAAFATVLSLATVAACGGPVATHVAPGHVRAANPSSLFAAEDWLNREHRVAALAGYQSFAKFRFEGGRWADSETVLQLAPPVYLDVTGDGVDDALLPLQIDEAPTALERGNPRFHLFLVFTVVDGRVVHVGELPMMTCGPLGASLEERWLRITTTPRGSLDDMCGRATIFKYRWQGGWFVDANGDEVTGKAL